MERVGLDEGKCEHCIACFRAWQKEREGKAWPCPAWPPVLMQHNCRKVLAQLCQAQHCADLAPPFRRSPVTQPTPKKVVHGDMFVAERFVGWQEGVLLALQAAFDTNTKVRMGVCVCALFVLAS